MCKYSDFLDLMMKPLPITVILLLVALTTGTIEDESISQEEVVVTVDSTNLRFSPSSVTITEGDTVRFFWSGELLAHNAVAYDGLFDSGDASRNVDYSFKFDVGTNGTHEYLCEPHEEFGMTGTIVVDPLTVVEDTSPDEDGGRGSLPPAGLLGTATMVFAAVILGRSSPSSRM